MKMHGPLILLVLTACNTIGEYEAGADTTPPRIRLLGLPIDTAYLNTYYKDMSADLLDEVNGELHCLDAGTNLKSEGYVNTSVPGTYTLNYTGFDKAGNSSATLTRTVHVFPNSISFLAGDYIVNYTCTASNEGEGVSTKTTSIGNFKAAIIPGTSKGHFEIASVNTGPMFKVINNAYLEGNEMIVDYWDTDYSKTYATGSLSADKNSFTIETRTFTYSHLSYICTNVYIKQVVIKQY